MADIKIFANGALLDIDQEVNVSIQRYVFDFQNPASQGGDHTYSINLPATRTNMEALGGAMVVDPGTTRKFTSQQDIQMEIHVDGLRVFAGTPEIERAGLEDGYDITIYSTNIDWVARISDKSIRDLTTLGTTPFTGYKTYGAPIEPVGAMRMQDYWGLTNTQTHLVFPLVAYGNYPRLGGLASGITANKIDEISWEDVAPCVFSANVFKAILNEAGLQISGGILDDPDFNLDYTPFTGDGRIPWNWGLLARANLTNAAYQYEYIPFPPSDNSDFAYNGARVWRLRTAVENWDYSDSYFITSPDEQYIVPTDGEYRFIIDLDLVLHKGLDGGIPSAGYDHERTALAIVIVSDDTDEYDAMRDSIADYIYVPTAAVVSDPNVIAFWDFGTGYSESPYTLQPFTNTGTYSQSVTGTPGTPGATLDGSGTLHLEINAVGLSRGMRVEFWIVSQDAVLDPINDQTFLAVTQEVDVKNTSAPDLLQVAQCLPDISQVDFIMSLVTAYNLKFAVDIERKVIRFQTLDQFHRSNQFARDWTGSCDDHQTPSRPVPIFAKSTLRWARDNNDKIATLFDASRFDATEQDGSIYADQSEEVIEVQVFAATFEREFYFKSLFGASPVNRIIVPCMASESQLNTPQGDIEWDYSYTPRLLKDAGMQPGSWIFHGVTYTEYPAARFSFSESGNQVLSFADNAGCMVRGAGLVQLSQYPSIGLWQRFWKRFFVLRRLSHIQEVSVRLTASEFALLDVADPIVVNGKAYWLYAFVDGFEPAQEGVMRIDLLRQV